MALLLYINGQLADLGPGQVIVQTKQVNDLNSLDDRQANYTNKFKLPKTANNIRIMDFLTLTGNRSDVPYQNNECSLYSESGEYFVHKGRAVITDGGEEYEAVLYDGIIDLFKAIENKSLTDLGLSDLNHDKTPSAVVYSWIATNAKYRYIVADYNGDMKTELESPPKVNIDYLVPSVNVSYLWKKIFQTFGFTFSGSVFETENFTNLWMAYPKGVSTGDGDTEVFESSNIKFDNPGGYPVAKWSAYKIRYDTEEDIPSENQLEQVINFSHLKVAETARYRIEIEGTVNADWNFKIALRKNAENEPETGTNVYKMLTDNQQEGEAFSYEHTLLLNQHETVSVVLMRLASGKPLSFKGDSNAMSVKLVKVSANKVDFSGALSDFSITDFMKEVVHRFGLTLFKDKYSSHYEFMTLQEQLQLAENVDWSSKFVKKVSENYIYGSYAQRNWFKYNYNDREQNHNDGYIDVGNVNLPAARDVIKYKIYSPEAAGTYCLGRFTHVYKLWEKEVADNPAEGEEPVKYKSLDKRYYFLRAEKKNVSVKAYSKGMMTDYLSYWYYAESFWKLPFQDIIQDYYQPVSHLLDKAQVVTAELYLKETDIVNFDFKKLYYFEQLASYFMMNKINNYVPGKPVRCELVRVQDIKEAIALPPAIKITKVIVGDYYIVVYFDLNIQADIVNLQISDDNQVTWDNWTMGAEQNPRYQSFTGNGTFHIRMQAGGETTPSIEIVIPSNQTIVLP